MTAEVTMDLHADFAAMCASALLTAGYGLATGPSAEIIRAYGNVRHRRVSQRPRTVHKASYTVPEALVGGEQAFLAAVAAGHDLRPYQSTRLDSAEFNDGMLNDFGVQHFHLGTTAHRTKPGFKARTEPVLFALVREDAFYSLGCYAHGAWSETALLDVVHENWPDVLAASAINPGGRNASKPGGLEIVGLAHTFTDEEHAKMRKAGVNVLTQRSDGTIHVGPGGGLNAAGQSGAVARDVARIKGLAQIVERDVEQMLAPLIESGELLPPITVRLEQRGEETFAVVDEDRGEFDLGRRLSARPL